MKKILSFIVFINVFIFAETVNHDGSTFAHVDCCSSGNADLGYTSTENKGSPYVSKTFDNGWSSDSSNYSHDYSGFSCLADGVWGGDYSNNINAINCSSSYNDYVCTEDVHYEEKGTCVCNEADVEAEPLPTPEEGKEWLIVYSQSCTIENGDIDLYNDFNGTKITISEKKECCSQSTYYILQSINCDVNQDKDGNGLCRDTCGTDGLMIDGECVERASCKEFYRDMTAISVGDIPNCNNPYNVDENRTMYMDIYNLFPNQEVTEESMLTCCYRDWSKDTDGDGIDDSIDADIDGDGENELEDTDGDGVADVYQDEKNSDNYNPTDSNTTNTDSNTTNIDSNVTNLNNEKLDGIREAVESGNTKNDQNLRDIKGSIESGNTKNDQNLRDIKGSIESGNTKNDQNLRDIKTEVKNGSDRNHEDLENIKDSIDKITEGKEDSDDPSKNGIGDITNALNDIISDATSTIPQKFNKLSNYAFGTVPVFAVSNGECVFQADTHTMGHIEMDLNPYIQMMLPFTSTMFSILFIIISVSWWFRAFKVIISVVV